MSSYLVVSKDILAEIRVSYLLLHIKKLHTKYEIRRRVLKKPLQCKILGIYKQKVRCNQMAHISLV